MALAIEQVLSALNADGVRYLVVGGVAVVLHGHLRTTADLHLVVELAPENARRAIAALGRLGFRPRAPVPAERFADPAARQAWIDDEDLTVFSLWSDRLPDVEVDLFVKEPFDFPRGFEGHRRAQAGLGLRLTPAERLRWLEETMAAMRRWQGRARQAAAPADTSPGPRGAPAPR